MTATLAPPAAATVLIVEDDPGIAELERIRLEDAGYRAVLAATADDALRQVGAGGVDLVLLDYRLPDGVDGLEFYARVKAAGYDLPVILVTGFGNEATVIKALRVGVRDFVTKSVEYLDYLPEAVARVLQQVGIERRLAESEARLTGVIESAKDAVIVVEGDRITLFNPAAERMFGCSAATALGRPLTEFIPPDPADADPLDVTRGVRPRVGGVGTRAGGEEFPIEATVAAGRTNGRRFHTVVVRDVTERRRLEEQFRQSQKMEAFGQLAGGVAHDFNNVLTVINGYTELAVNSLPAGHPAREMLHEVSAAGGRAAALTAQLLAFGRRAVLDPRVIDPNATVREMSNMLRRLIGENVVMEADVGRTVGRVRVDPGQLGQVLLNLAVNARDAMPRGGRLTVSTRDVDLSADHARRHPGATPGRHVLLSVSDTGSGMTDAVKARIFEPFFTTKEPGKGTGLGLATVYGIVQQSGGHIAVDSTAGGGTTFRVYLPAVEAVGEEAAAEPAVDGRGSETVLLVEDQEDVRKLARLALEAAGYTVTSAADGADALRLTDGRPPVDILVTDVVMPGMSGRELADAYRQRHPGVRVLYTSGYTEDAAIRDGGHGPHTAFLQKPYTPDALARKVREVLDG